MKTVAALAQTFSRIAMLASLCAGGSGSVFGLFLCSLVLAANLSGVYIGTLFIAWNKAFFDALEKVAVEETVFQVGVFLLLAFSSAALFLIGQYIRKGVYMRWRTRLNTVVLQAWLNDHTYWRLQPGMTDQAVDNPDQRIAEDCRLFVDDLLELSFELITKIVALVTFLSVLWNLSSFPLSFTVFGLDIAIPRYMVWSAFTYVALSSWLTHVLGAPLKDLLFRQQKREADYRFALARMRDHAAQIALSRGEAAERRILDKRFSAIIDNWYGIIAREFILGCFTRPYFQTVLRIPMFLALPAYLAGRVSLGGLMQVSSAFSSVVTTLSWFIFSYRELAEWVATTDRLAGLLERTYQIRGDRSGFAFDSHDHSNLIVSGLRVRTPEGRELRLPEELTIRQGEHAWLRAPSGTGKSTLIKAVAGIWRFGSGHIAHPRDWRPAFVPQDVYLCLGSMDENAAYPLPAEAGLCSSARDALAKVGLSRLSPDDIPEEADTAVGGLSGGERQRLAFSRLLVQKPDWIFLDETINALDADAARDLLGCLIDRLEDVTLVVVSHTPPEVAGIAFREIPLQNEPV